MFAKFFCSLAFGLHSLAVVYALLQAVRDRSAVPALAASLASGWAVVFAIGLHWVAVPGTGWIWFCGFVVALLHLAAIYAHASQRRA
jgi:hypothetical protein